MAPFSSGTIATGPKVFSLIDSEESPRITRIDSGSYSLFGIDENGKIHGSSGVPNDLGPVDFVRTGRSYAIARLRDGTTRVWGKAIPEIDLNREKFRHLFDFDCNLTYVHDANFIIGIEPSYLSGFTQFTVESPDLKNVLAEFESDRLAADDEVEAFENRYLEELEKLKVAAAKNKRERIVAQIEDEIANFRDRSRPAILQPKRLADLQKIYRDGAPERETSRDSNTVLVYEKSGHQTSNHAGRIYPGKKVGGGCRSSHS